MAPEFTPFPKLPRFTIHAVINMCMWLQISLIIKKCISILQVLWCSAFSKASDVWSFGVLVWEVFNKGQIPYSDLQNDQLKEKVRFSV